MTTLLHFAFSGDNQDILHFAFEDTIPVYINSAIERNASSSSTISSTTFETFVGNVLIVGVSNYTGGSPTVSSISDTSGNTYTRCGVVQGGDSTHKQEVWKATCSTAVANNSVTVTFSSDASYRILAVVQYRHVESWYQQGDHRLTNATTLHDTPSFSVARSPALLFEFGVTWDTALAHTAVTNSSLRIQDAIYSTFIADRIITENGNYTAAVTTVGNVSRSIMSFLFSLEPITASFKAFWVRYTNVLIEY